MNPPWPSQPAQLVCCLPSSQRVSQHPAQVSQHPSKRRKVPFNIQKRWRGQGQRLRLPLSRRPRIKPSLQPHRAEPRRRGVRADLSPSGKSRTWFGRLLRRLGFTTRAGEPPSPLAAPAELSRVAGCPVGRRGTGVTGEPRCSPNPSHKAIRGGGAPAHSCGSGDALWWQEWGYNPSSPLMSGAEADRGRARLSPHLPAPSPFPVLISVLGERGPIPAPPDLGRGSEHQAAPTGGSWDGSTGALGLPAPQSLPPRQHPCKLGQPGQHPAPRGPPPRTPMYLLAEGPTAPAGWRAGCRAERG